MALISYKEKIIFYFLLISFLQCFCFKLSAQNNSIDSVAQKFNLYNARKTQLTLFAHFDKNVYAQNENIWFTAYLLNRKYNNNPDVLSISLVNDLNRSVVLEQKFLMSDGISFGNIFLSDTIPSGNYSFMMYTNELSKGKPEDVFIQHITVAATSESSFKTSLSLDTSSGSLTKGKAILTIVTEDSRPISDAKINYTIGDTKHPLVTGSAKTDNEGKCYITVPFSQINADNNILEAQIKYNKDVQNVNMVLPVNKKQISVKFYPEGGYLVHATTGWVGWETKNADGTPLKVNGILYKDNIPADTIETDSYGMGKFKLIPVEGSVYGVKLMRSDFHDSIFKLPKIIIKSPVISIPSALANDTLKINLTSKYPENITVLVHNYRQIFYAIPVKTYPYGKTVLIDLKDVPKGLAAITVLDSIQKPCAERLFFAHYNKRALIDIHTDKPRYGKREKIKLSLKFKTPDTGLVSVACIQSNRIQIKKNNDIESYVYLKHELDALPLKENYMGNSDADKKYLENVLLIKGWRRYTWPEMMQTSVSDTASRQDLLVFKGTVTHLDKQLKKFIRFVVMTDSTTTTVSTDHTGNFTLSNNTIIADENKKVHFLVMESNKDDYNVLVNDPYSKINRELADELQSMSNLSNSNNAELLKLKGFEHAIALKEVKIKDHKIAANSLDPASFDAVWGHNICGDYVCRYNVLNCVNHQDDSGNRPPVVGALYHVIGVGLVVYKGCSLLTDKISSQKLFSLGGIKFSKAFYGSDYSIFNPSEPEYISTIFWKHLVRINSSNEAQLEFYTSDITGPFKIIVQGVTQNDVVFGEKEFIVK